MHPAGAELDDKRSSLMTLSSSPLNTTVSRPIVLYSVACKVHLETPPAIVHAVGTVHDSGNPSRISISWPA